jgi:hypothetical protein
LLCLNRSIGNPKRFNLQTSLASYLTLTKPEKNRDEHAIPNAQAYHCRNPDNFPKKNLLPFRVGVHVLGG